MISIAQPAMALNAENVPGPDYKMWNTRKVEKKEDPVWVMKNVATVARSATGARLKSLVINCHGYYGVVKTRKYWFDETGGGFGLSLGQGITRVNVEAVFREITGLVDTIWIVACGAAQISTPGGGGDGNLFCCAIAKTVGCDVYASTDKQSTWLLPSVPYGKIDGYEGKVYRYKSDGSAELTAY